MKKLSNKEMEVMQVFWNSDHALASCDIPRLDNTLNINTVRVAIKNLLKKSYIEAADIVQRGTVLTHTYRPSISFETYLNEQLKHINFNSLNLVCSLVKQEKSSVNLDELERIINEHRHTIE